MDAKMEPFKGADPKDYLKAIEEVFITYLSTEDFTILPKGEREFVLIFYQELKDYFSKTYENEKTI
jgi:hypothetical protein